MIPCRKLRNERLRLLFDHGYLARIFPAACPFGGAVYYVGKAGVPVGVQALANGGMELDALQAKALARRPCLSTIDHSLAISDVYIACCAGPQKGAVSTRRFLPEPLSRIEFEYREPGGQWRRGCFAPDGALLLDVGGTGAVAFLEIDMGTVPTARFAAKCRGFSAVVAGRLSAALSAGPSLFATVTVSERRLRQILRCAEGVPNVAATTLDEVRRDGLLTKWTVPSGARASFTQIVSKGTESCSV